MNVKNVISGVLAAVASLTLSAENLVFNGSFEDGKPGASYILPGWVRRTAGNSFDFHKIDKTNASEGSRSGCITIPADKPKGSGYLTTSKRFPLQSGKKYRLTLDAKCPQGKALVYLIAYDSKNKAVSYSRYGKLNIANSADWKKFELIYTAPTQDPAGYTGALQLTLQGAGEVWFDNVKVEALDKAAAPAAAAPSKHAASALSKIGENLIPNGSFEDGKPGASQILPGWVRRTAGGSFGFHSIDATKAASGKRSVRIAIPETAPAKSTGYVAANWIKVAPGKCYKLSYKAYCAQGNASATIILHDAQKRYAGFGGVRTSKVKNAGDWQTFEMEYFTPGRSAESYYICLQLELHGTGEVWFDDVRLEEVAPAAVKTEFYPSELNYSRKLTGIAGEQLSVIFYFFTSGKRDGFVLDLEVPANLLPVFSGVTYAVNTPQIPAVPQKGAAAGYKRYRLQLTADAVQPMQRFAGDLFSGLSLLFDGDPGVDGRLKWQLSQGGKKLDGGEFKLEMLPQEKVTLPRYPVIFSWYEPYLNYVRDSAVLQKYLNNILRSGITGASVSESKEIAMFNTAGFTNQRGFWQQAPGNCLTGMIGNQKIWDRIDLMAKNLSVYNKAVLCWNFEPDLRDFYHYCPQCHRAFCKFAKLPESTKISDGYNAEKLYPEEYMRFRCSQHNYINETFDRICKKNKVISGINGYRVTRGMNMLELKRRTGGVREIIERVDIYQAQIYALPDLLWHWQMDMLKYNPNTMITYTTDERNKGGTYPYSLITPELIECEVLIAGIQRVKNLVFFVGYHTLDGKQILALRRALSRIAAREDMLDGKAEYISAQGNELVRWRKFTRNGRTMLAAVNCDSTRQLWSAVPLTKDMAAVDLEKSIGFMPDKQNRLAVRLNPYEVRFFEIVKKSELSKYSVESAALPDQQPQARSLFKNADWNLFEDASGVISVKFNQKELWQIRRNDGAILGCKSYNGKSGFFFRDLFNVPREAAWSADCRQGYEFTGASTDGKALKIGFKRDLIHRQLKGLQLQKVYRITPEKISCRITVVNLGNVARRIAFWQHHRPSFPVKKAIKFTSGSKSLTIDVHSPTNNYLTGGSSTLQSSCGMQLVMSQTPEKYYFWHDQDHPVSCEMFFPAVDLEPGKNWQIVSQLQKM